MAGKVEIGYKKQIMKSQMMNYEKKIKLSTNSQSSRTHKKCSCECACRKKLPRGEIWIRIKDKQQKMFIFGDCTNMPL